MKIRRATNFRVVLLSSALAFTAPLCARENTDVLVMKNGDRLTCRVKELDQGVLYVSLDYVVQTISVEWSKVARIESNHLFIVKAEDGTVYRGILKTAESPASPAGEDRDLSTSEEKRDARKITHRRTS